MQTGIAGQPDTAEIEIVATSAQHVEGFNRVLTRLAAEKKFLAATEPPALEETRKFVLGMIERNCPTFMAVDGGKVVGWCDLARGKGAHLHVGVLGMGLLPEFRHRGIGRRLLARALAAARDAGITRIELTVREQNLNAVSLYKKEGFEIEGLKKHSHRIDGAYENSYLMSLLLLPEKPR
jgi:ribosomal protein S18 acetylase RimI-like enzyme